jgi:hypothetical protein
MSDPNTDQPSSSSVRLIFEYHGDDVRLVSQQPVDMAITGYDLPQEMMPGYHVEVRDADDAVLSRVPVRADLSATREVFPEQPGEPITRVEVPEPSGAFTVVVPAPQHADHLTLVNVTHAPGTADRAAAAPFARERMQVTELGRFPLEGASR